MKARIKVSAALAVLLLTGSTEIIALGNSNNINVGQKQIIDGLIYDINNPNPYTGTVTNYYKNRNKLIEENYVDGEKHGKLIKWYENGHKEMDVDYVNGVQHGKLTKWYENGQKAGETNYAYGKVER